ncbi:tRNA (adenosine(37)-N6)-dimethylallyltransferase MiaA [Roseicitreum antarcticum]|uniref:tRNA dimethylallyltransferase n=1 Tax=Roseicitreum antarcticum TaxID=564137 RepID=A0A1H2VTM5_9RHOB|nr:tRNA (adenosine(37)-N6)-dimethylallyltransferase MiaA [Roseicitreum antarcticum]SDW71708.1 tRNA dimethylallyltransferase [Roseicitreum antarcticum]
MHLTDAQSLPDPARPVLLAGPTASGKSTLAMAWARAQGRVIVNADALQVYDCWHVLTARPPIRDTDAVPHLLYGHIDRSTAYSVGHWLREVADVLARHSNPVIVGGTGLYFSALTRGLADIPPTPPGVRADADGLLASGGGAAMLAALDPDTRARIDTQNPARIQRAWEVWKTTGRGLASWQDDTAPPLVPLQACTAYVMAAPPDWLSPRVDSRLEAMVQGGALDEVRKNLPFWQQSAPWARAIGAPELTAHLQHQISLSDAVEAAKLATRQYAKRQRTWFRNRMGTWTTVFVNEP